MERLREEVARTYFDQMSEALANPDPEQLAHMREAFDALNRMIEQREAGEPIDPSFESFMEQFGDLFPGNPADLDELLEQLAARMAAAQAMWNSMSPEQRAQLQGLAESLLEDLDLRWQVDRLAGNLQRAFPGPGWEQRYRFSGDEPMGMGEGTDAAGRLRDLDELEDFLRSANSPASSREVDLDKVRQHLGDDAARSLDRLAKLAKQLADAGLIDQREGRFELTPKGIRRIGQQALSDLFDQLNKDRVGNHRTTWTGHRSRPRGDHQALRVRGPVQPGPLPHRAQRGAPGGQRRAGPPVPRRLRGHRDRGPDPLGHRAAPRPLAVHADAGQLRPGQEDGHGPPHADLDAVPARLPGAGRVLRGGPGHRARGPAHGELGLRLRDQPAARADPGPQDAGPSAGDQADHPGHRRGAHRPRDPLRGRVWATTCTSTTRRSPRRSR